MLAPRWQLHREKGYGRVQRVQVVQVQGWLDRSWQMYRVKGTVFELKSLILWLMVLLIPGHYPTWCLLCTGLAFLKISKCLQLIDMCIKEGHEDNYYWKPTGPRTFIFMLHLILSQVCREDIGVFTSQMRKKFREIRYFIQSPQLLIEEHHLNLLSIYSMADLSLIVFICIVLFNPHNKTIK